VATQYDLFKQLYSTTVLPKQSAKKKRKTFRDVSQQIVDSFFPLFPRIVHQHQSSAMTAVEVKLFNRWTFEDVQIADISLAVSTLPYHYFSILISKI